MDFLKSILAEKGSELTAGLVDRLGFSSEQAAAFVPEAASSTIEAVKGRMSDLDLSDLAASAGSVVEGIDVDSLAQKVGIDASQASSGLSAIVPGLLSALQQKAGDLGGLTSLLGGEGVGKTLGNLAGKLFDR